MYPATAELALEIGHFGKAFFFFVGLVLVKLMYSKQGLVLIASPIK